MKTIVFDLDDTICTPNLEFPDTKTRYGNALPIHSVIVRMNKLKKAGYRIVIHTARRMVTHKGDIELIKQDVEQITIDWLEYYGVPYDELIFGKPYADTYYVDDKAMNLDDFYKWTDDESSYR